MGFQSISDMKNAAQSAYDNANNERTHAWDSARQLLVDGLPDRLTDAIEPIDRRRVHMALVDACADDTIQARQAINILRQVSFTCSQRAKTAAGAEEARAAQAAADCIEGLAAAAELVLTGKNSSERVN